MPPVIPPIVPPVVIAPPLSPPALGWLTRSPVTNLPDVVVEPLVPSTDPPQAEHGWGGPPNSWAGPNRSTTP